MLVTPWDIIDMLTDANGQSLIKTIQFPSKTVNVTFTVNNTLIPNVYDINLDQFMGMTTAAILLEKYNIVTDIFEISRPISSFNYRLGPYNRKYNDKQYKYSLKAIRGVDDDPTYGYDTFRFDSMDFIAGFITPFSWIGEDHHKYWTEFKEEGKTLTF